MAEEREQLSLLTTDERAALDAVERDEEGNLIPHEYHPHIKAYHEARARIDSDYVEPTTEERERSEEAAYNAERDAQRG